MNRFKMYTTPGYDLYLGYVWDAKNSRWTTPKRVDVSAFITKPANRNDDRIMIESSQNKEINVVGKSDQGTARRYVCEAKKIEITKLEDAAAATAVSCPENYDAIGKGCYKFIGSEKLDWRTSVQRCTSNHKGIGLAAPNEEAQWLLLKAGLQRIYDNTQDPYIKFWLGYICVGSILSDGNKKALSWHDWKSSNECSKDVCIRTSRGIKSQRFTDKSCSEPYNYVCELAPIHYYK